MTCNQSMIGLSISKGPNANIYKAIYKGDVCAMKVYKGATFSAVCREHRILMLLSSHPGIPHAFGVKRSCASKLVLSSFNHPCKRLNTVVFETQEEFGCYAASLLDTVLHLQKSKCSIITSIPATFLLMQQEGSVVWLQQFLLWCRQPLDKQLSSAPEVW